MVARALLGALGLGELVAQVGGLVGAAPVGALLGPLAAEPFLYQRDVRGMSLDEICAGWHALCDAVLASGAAAGAAPSTLLPRTAA